MIITVNASDVDDALDEETLLNMASIRYPFLFAYITVFLLCVVGNVTIIMVVVVQRSMRTVTNFFLANLAVADLLVGIFCVLQNATHFVLLSHGRWPFGALLCHAYVYVLHLIPNASAGILVLLSIERFIAVLRPMIVQHLLTRGVLVASTLLVWSASAMMNSPYLIAAQYLEFDDFGSCTRKNILIFGNQMNVLKVVTTVNFIVWYSIPLSLLFGIYFTIGVVLFRSTAESAVARSSTRGRHSLAAPRNSKEQYTALLCRKDGSVAAMCGAHHRKTSKVEALGSRRRVIRLVVIIVLSFALLSIPRYIYLMWSLWRDNREPRCLHCLSALIQPITFLLMFLNSAINPLLYAFLSKRFRVAIVDTLCCRRERDKRRTRVLQLNARRISGLRVSNGGGAHSNALYYAVDKRDPYESAFENSCV